MYMIFFFTSVHLEACPPPPPPPPLYQKAGYATVASFRSPEEWPNEDGCFPPPPPHSLHEIAATECHAFPTEYNTSVVRGGTAPSP